MNNLRPGAIAMLAGGVVLLISTFLDWFSISESGFSFGSNLWDLRGLWGFIMLVLAADAIAIPAIQAFAPQVKLPDEVLGFSMIQVVMVAGWAAFVLSFSMLLGNNTQGIGTILGLLASIAILVGAYMENSAGSTTLSSEPPRTI